MSNSRRSFLTGAAGLAALGAVGPTLLGASGSAHAAMGKGPDKINMRDDGTYETVELAKPSWTIGLMQTPVHTFEVSAVKAGMKRNLQYISNAIDKAFYYAKPDLLFFHEFPLTGWRKWNRAEAEKMCIEIPGPETDVIAAKAREHNSWIVFGAYVRDPAWPGHVLSITTIINNKGEIVDKHWKARNVKGLFPDFELFTTTIYDVMDQYVEMYGRDAVLPITRTPLGNIATSSTQREPEIFRAMAMKGAEIFLRTATGGFEPVDMQATSLYNGTYTAVVNNSISPDNGPFFDDPGSGGTALYGPDGKMLIEASSKNEQMVQARIDIAALRARKRQPSIHMSLYNDVFEKYKERYAPNLFSEYQPTSLEDAGRFLKDKSRWK
jgi:predicted amidohydrolase